MDIHAQVKRMEKAIEAEPDKVKRWAMRKVLKSTIQTLEDEK